MQESNLNQKNNTLDSESILHTHTLTNNHKNDNAQSFIQNKKTFRSRNVLINYNNITSGGTDVRGDKMGIGDNRETNHNINPNNSVKRSMNPERRNRYIPLSVRKKVFQRAKGCCEFVGLEGTRCSSRHQLEFDHIVAWSHGGENDEASLQVLCRQHNQFRLKETHGFWYQKR